MKQLTEAVHQLYLKTHYRDSKGESQYFMATPEGNLTFKIQDGPIKEVGQNGAQAADLLLLCKELFHALNKSYPCRENSLTITKIEEALHWQEARTRDRVGRKVEGRNAA